MHKQQQELGGQHEEAACILAISACAVKPEVVDLITETEDGEGAVKEKLCKISREGGDVWHLNDDKNIILYYNKDGIVENIMVTERTA